MTAWRCHTCGATVGPVERVGRRDTCPRCGADLHCCRNCEFHDPQRHNECIEPQAERQVDKDAGNFCEYFHFGKRGPAKEGPPSQARAGLEALFRRRSK